MIRTIKINKDYGTKEIKYKFPKDKKLVNLFMSKEELEIIIRILKQVFNQVNFQLPNDVKAFEGINLNKKTVNMDIDINERHTYFLDNILEELEFKRTLK